jgi:hypothetical protein
MVVPSFLCCEHVCFMWPRKSLLTQPPSLDSDVPVYLRREEAQEGRTGERTEKAYWDVEIIHDEPKPEGG